MEKRPNYKRNTRVLLLAAAAALLVCAAALFFKQQALSRQGAALPAQGSPQQSVIGYYSPKPSSSQESGETSPSPPADGSSGASSGGQSRTGGDQERYLITVSDGKIGVFRQGESAPFLTADIDVYLLPDEDVSILKKGIRVTGFSQVKSVLEDYE